MKHPPPPPYDHRTRVRQGNQVRVRVPGQPTPGVEYPTLPLGYPQIETSLGTNLLKHIYSGPRYAPQKQLVVSPEIGVYSGAFPIKERSGVPTSTWLLPRDRNFTAPVLDVPLREPVRYGNPIPNVFP